MTVVWASLILISVVLTILFLRLILSFSFLIEKIYQTLETVFHQIFKHVEFRQKYSAARRIFNCLLGEWKSDDTEWICDRISLSQTRLSRKPRYLDLKPIPLALVFQSFTISYLKHSAISNCVSFPLRVRDSGVQLYYLKNPLIFYLILVWRFYNIVYLRWLQRRKHAVPMGESNRPRSCSK